MVPLRGDDRPSGSERREVTPDGIARPIHPAAARLIEEVRASGEFTEDTWRNLSRAMDDLDDVDLAAVLEEIGRTADRKTGS